MPVVATMTIIALLRGNASSDQPFFDPDLLRDMLAEGLEGDSDVVRADAMALAHELETLIEQYRASVDSTIDAYIDSTRDPRLAAADLSESFAAMDEKRARLMRAIIRTRRSLIEVFTEAQWDAVFG